MGLKQRTTSGAYVKLKDGKFYLAQDESKTAYDELEGTLTNIYIKDETYEGKPVRKLYLVMNDGEQNLIINFAFDSRYGTSFLSFIKNVDLSKPFSLCPISKEKLDGRGEKVTEKSLLIKQNGNFVKAYFKKDTPNGLPQMRKVKINGKDVWDKTDMLDFLEDMIDNDIKPQLTDVQPKITIKEETPLETYTPVEETEDTTDELPWEK